MRALGAIDAAVFAALSAPDVVDAAVHQHVPASEVRDFPHVVLGDFDNVTPIGIAGDEDLRADLAIVVMTEAEERDSCVHLVGQITGALDGETLTAGAFTIALAAQSATIALDESGKGYNAVLTFGVLALTE